jgi:hypothetical protein
MRYRLTLFSLLALTLATVRCSSVDPRIPSPGEVPDNHRAVAAACVSTPSPDPDAGSTACKTNADCASAPWLESHCLHGYCTQDSCLTDSDCGTSGVCACANGGGGNAPIHPNVCVTSGNCRVDADCGAGGYCTPSRGYCGIYSGFYCHRPGDSCVDPKIDCSSAGQSCVYDQAAGHFSCASTTCNG